MRRALATIYRPIGAVVGWLGTQPVFFRGAAFSSIPSMVRDYNHSGAWFWLTFHSLLAAWFWQQANRLERQGTILDPSWKVISATVKLPREEA
jgi:hypothetical protein